MGFHVCEYCGKETSSGDVFLGFTSGRGYIVPDMILHYVADHDYRPPQEFIDDIMGSELVAPGKPAPVVDMMHQLRGKGVGYLKGPFPIFTGEGEVAPFFLRLWRLMSQANRAGARLQTRGM